MDLNYTPEEQAFREEVRAFVRANLPRDIAEKVLHHRRLVKDDFARWQKILYKQGWIAGHWPREYGGQGWTPVQTHIFDEECAAAGAPRLIPFGLNMVAPVIMAFGTPRQKEHYLPRILSQEDFWCQGYSEPGVRLRPRLAQDPRRARGRPLRRQRPEDLDDAGALRRLDLLPGAHRSDGEEAGRHLASSSSTCTRPGITVRPLVTIDGSTK